MLRMVNKLPDAVKAAACNFQFSLISFDIFGLAVEQEDFCCVLKRHNSSSRETRDPGATGAASAYENELLILKRRRRELEYQLDEPTKRNAYHNRSIYTEIQWVDKLKKIGEFYYKKRRMPKKGAPGEEGQRALWINRQRYAKHCRDLGKPCNHKMTPERIFMLESMSWWVWDVYEAAWEAKFEELQEYVKKHGKIPPISHPTLGNWIDTQRRAYRAWQERLNGEPEKYQGVHNGMNEDRAAKLESVPGWSWDPWEENWEAKYQELLQYVAEHNKIPPVSHLTLGDWINNQRIACRAWQGRLNGETEKYHDVTHIMTEERAAKLESIPCWKWDMSV